MADQTIVFRLPLDGWPRAVFESDYSFRGGRLLVDDAIVASASSRQALERGISAPLPKYASQIALRMLSGDGMPEIEVTAGGVVAPREDRLSAPTSRSAWIHAIVALLASAAGFVASYLYLLKAQATADPWPMKMAIHMSGWHLLLTLTLFPASVWGQRFGIRAVQAVSLLFFLIHAGISISNIVFPDPNQIDGPWIAALNALSGILFAASTVYGQRAHRDMDPLAALDAPDSEAVCGREAD